MHPNDLYAKGTYKLKVNDEDPEIDISAHFLPFDPTENIKNLEMGLKFV